ncbi:MAG: rRNA maturation RNase YbeY [Dehalococcoidia bacterium]|nr:rRNA maturation RNase YbeY [Dehalococcoidia bacterium]
MSHDLTIEVQETVAGAVDVAALERLVQAALEGDAVEDGAALTLVIAGDELLRSLNREHRDVDEPTDVLSFPASELAEGEDAFPTAEGTSEAGPRYLGDIAVSVETVRRQAPEAGLTLEVELQHVVLHGLLHLLGYDHETPEDRALMRAREEALLGPEIHAHDASHTDD